MEDLSYKRYRKYRANQYQYKVDQVTGPILMILLIFFVSKHWWIIVSAFAVLLIMRCRKKKHQTVKTVEEVQLNCEEKETMKTTEKGFVNCNNQRNNGRTDKPGTDFGQWFYDMECLECGHRYYANGSNIYEKKCPLCQGSQGKKELAVKNSTSTGFINKNNQRNNGKTEKPGTDFGQWFYDMECLNCGHKYYANGSDIWQRKCPCCQGGRL